MKEFDNQCNDDLAALITRLPDNSALKKRAITEFKTRGIDIQIDEFGVVRMAQSKRIKK